MAGDDNESQDDLCLFLEWLKLSIYVLFPLISSLLQQSLHLQGEVDSFFGSHIEG